MSEKQVSSLTLNFYVKVTTSSKDNSLLAVILRNLVGTDESDYFTWYVSVQHLESQTVLPVY